MEDLVQSTHLQACKEASYTVDRWSEAIRIARLLRANLHS